MLPSVDFTFMPLFFVSSESCESPYLVIVTPYTRDLSLLRDFDIRMPKYSDITVLRQPDCRTPVISAAANLSKSWANGSRYIAEIKGLRQK